MGSNRLLRWPRFSVLLKRLAATRNTRPTIVLTFDGRCKPNPGNNTTCITILRNFKRSPCAWQAPRPANCIENKRLRHCARPIREQWFQNTKSYRVRCSDEQGLCSIDSLGPISMPTKLKNLYPGKLPLPQLDVSTYDPQTIHYHKIQDDR